MSKKFPQFSLVFAAFVLILQIFTNTFAQTVDIRITVAADKVVTADVKVAFAPDNEITGQRDIWFLDDYAGITGLNERRSIVYLRDKQGYLIARKRFLAGERVIGANIGAFGYSVDLTPLAQQGAAAHVSWANDGGGFIMLDDLLPQSAGRTANVKFEMPLGWKVLSTEVESEPNYFAVSDIEKAVFYIGPNLREQEIKSGASRLLLSITGEWLFSEPEAKSMVESIVAEYGRTFGNLPGTPVRVRIGRFPVPVRTGSWEADTRGRSLTIISSDMPFKSQSLQRLHEQLRHELFHLWIPNGVNLSGNYDWFYEGFALYQSLKLGVGSNRIRFDDFLDTLSRAYNIDISQNSRLSLIDASKLRWSGGANTRVYARGMLVAFLCDLALLESSRGKRSVADVLREVYRKHGAPNPVQDGNAAVLSILRGYPQLGPVIDRNITGAENLDWIRLITAAGLEAGTRDQLVRLKTVANPSGRQRDLLDKLGYNDWRKLSK